MRRKLTSWIHSQNSWQKCQELVRYRRQGGASQNKDMTTWRLINDILGGKNTTCMHTHQSTMFQHTAVAPCSLVLSFLRLPSSGLFSGTWALRQAPGDLWHVYVFPPGHCLNSTTRWIANRCMIKKIKCQLLLLHYRLWLCSVAGPFAKPTS